MTKVDHSPGDRNPVLLVHGLNDTAAVFEPMTAHLTRLGWTVHSLDLKPNNGSFLLERLAIQVADYVNTIVGSEHPIDLIGFSMGGIVTRYYLQRLKGIDRVQRYISIAAPNHGTLAAYLLPLPGIVQMRPDNPFLQDLNQDGAEICGQINFTVMWTPFDLLIIPGSSSQMAVGKDVKLPVLLHSEMLTDPRAIAAVTTALSEPLKPDHRSRLTHDPRKSPQNADKI